MRFVFVLASFLMLSGCLTAQERAAQVQAKRERLNAEDDQKCQSYGAKPGSDGYVMCRTQLDTSRQQATATRDAGAAAANAGGGPMVCNRSGNTTICN
jgi:outer membrane biogenesis lipoprotein LolB